MLDAVAESFAAAGRYNRDDKVQPVVVLWADPTRAWEPVIDLLRGSTPILTLGEFNAASQSGPAIWIRCQLAEPRDHPIVVYLPGVERSDLRAIETSPPNIQPLAELQFRAAWWQHGSHGPWTPAGFLRSADGLALDLGRDDATSAALALALREIIATPVDVLMSKGRIDASYLSSLLVSDANKLLLEWLDAPDQARAARSANEWSAFLGQCRSTFGLDIESVGPLTVAQELAGRAGAWGSLWERFADAPHLYPNIPDRLRQAKPPATALFELGSGPWPQDNEEAEVELAAALASLGAGSPTSARDRIRALEEEHAPRRDSVWAKLGQTPLADALSVLDHVAQTTASLPAVDSVDAFTQWYAADGHKVDQAAIAALTKVTDPPLREVVGTALRATYLPWLDDVARAFQEAMVDDPASDVGLTIEDGDCVIFVDGLRLDVGQTLRARLGASGMTASLTPRIAAVPTMTSSGKPAVSPLTVALGSGGALAPTSDGVEVNAPMLRKLLVAESVQTLSPDETGETTGRAWTETGDLDGTGHKLGIKLVDRIAQEVADVATRVQQLLGAGWKRVHIVTDHGWLLMPGGLPKVELPVHLAVTRKSRCARLTAGAGNVDQPTFKWTWDPSVRIVVPRGVAAFEAGCIYEHGGVSPQESITPHIIVTSGAVVGRARIEGVRWRGLRCRVDFAQVPHGASLDVRRMPGDAAGSLVTSKAVEGTDEASVLVEDDSAMGLSAFVVIVSVSGEILAQLPTKVGD
ncbi:BREX-1 system phosphatase PglZ type B [Mycolicibacterium sphagni]|uniref:BREX-1 system phosphatase PglZ type B n=1 Tax=Mycolicibacterium sphagni TaxID=1786 RepID=UPI0021F37DD1|nr:BREX-1 system phosphatase PglZ type B [Mycolicibacterium sphagni]MCV7176147.1 BREX-1 system phosphatase PglZ type B [Mycolicibacterium sphagni]